MAGISGLDPMHMKVFIGVGMLLNDAAAMDVAHLNGDWARACLTQVPNDVF